MQAARGYGTSLGVEMNAKSVTSKLNMKEFLENYYIPSKANSAKNSSSNKTQSSHPLRKMNTRGGSIRMSHPKLFLRSTTAMLKPYEVLVAMYYKKCLQFTNVYWFVAILMSTVL